MLTTDAVIQEARKKASSKYRLEQLLDHSGSDLFLYHGSRRGIEGQIQPISRSQCDFGTGFYMGNNSMQVKGLVIGEIKPQFYQLHLDLTKIPDNKILILNGYDWMFTVLAYRQRSETFNHTKLSAYYYDWITHFDIVAGPIADDRMNVAIRQFEQGLITDKVLLECLRQVDYGYQIVAKTPQACKAISIVDHRSITDSAEIARITEYADEMRKKGKDTIVNMNRLYRRQGQYIDDIATRYDHYGRYSLEVAR